MHAKAVFAFARRVDRYRGNGYAGLPFSDCSVFPFASTSTPQHKHDVIPETPVRPFVASRWNRFTRLSLYGFYSLGGAIVVLYGKKKKKKIVNRRHAIALLSGTLFAIMVTVRIVCWTFIMLLLLPVCIILHEIGNRTWGQKTICIVTTRWQCCNRYIMLNYAPTLCFVMLTLTDHGCNDRKYCLWYIFCYYRFYKPVSKYMILLWSIVDLQPRQLDFNQNIDYLFVMWVTIIYYTFKVPIKINQMGLI